MKILISSISSDSHTWNLVYLQLLLEELGNEVINLGSCVSNVDLVRQTELVRPQLVVISSVNGHGYIEGMEIIRQLSSIKNLYQFKVVIGGKLGTQGFDGQDYNDKLLRSGYDAVFTHNTAVADFVQYLKKLILLSSISQVKLLAR